MERARTVDGQAAIGFCEYRVDARGFGFVIETPPRVHDKQLLRLQGLLAMLSLDKVRFDMLSAHGQGIQIRGHDSPTIFLRSGAMFTIGPRTMGTESYSTPDDTGGNEIELVYAAISHRDERKFRIKSLVQRGKGNTIYLPTTAELFELAD